MTSLVVLNLETQEKRTQALESGSKILPLSGLQLKGARGLIISREEGGGRPWYRVDSHFNYRCDGSERDLIAQFDKTLSSIECDDGPVIIVGFRSSTLDLPLLRFSAMRHAIPLKFLGAPGENRYGTWVRRQEPRLHFDLAREIFGHRTGSLDEACKILGIPPARISADGYSSGHQMEELGELRVLSIWGMFLRWAIVINELTPQTFEKSLDSFFDFLSLKAETSPYLAGWISAWDGSARPLSFDPAEKDKSVQA